MKPVHIHVHNHVTRDAGFDESKHPRAEDGKFGSGGGSSSSNSGKTALALGAAKTARDNAEAHHRKHGTMETKMAVEREDRKVAEANKAHRAAMAGEEAAKGVSAKTAPAGQRPAKPKKPLTFKDLNGKHTQPGGDHPDKIVLHDKQGTMHTVSRGLGENRVKYDGWSAVPHDELNKKTLI